MVTTGHTAADKIAVSDPSKFQKAGQYISAFENWVTCLRLRQAVGSSTDRTQVVRLRNGLQMAVRVGTPDISILWEVLVSHAYASAEDLIRAVGGPCSVVDLGGNIGAFTLRCAHLSPSVHVQSYEPGPQNAAMLRRNLGLNPGPAARVTFYEEAAARQTGIAFWHFDAKNPGGSALTVSSEGLKVQTCSFRDILARCTHPVAFVKIDIEGSEYQLLDGTDKQDWEQAPAVLTELHPDPAQKSTPEEWLRRMADFGFTHQQREYSSLLLRR